MEFKNKSKLIEKRDHYFLKSSKLLMPELDVFVAGDMQYLYDSKGKKYLDMLGGYSVVSVGHANPAITTKIKAQLDAYTHSTQVFLNEPILNLCDALSEYLPKDMSKFLFMNSGSEANDFAMMLAKSYTNRPGVMHLSSSLHGRTQHTLAITGMKMWHPYDMSSDTVYEVPSYYKNEVTSLSVIEDILDNNTNIGCMIIEMIQANAGVLTTHADYFIKLSKILKKHDVLLIIDEAQTCMGRTGTFFAHEQFGIQPDILMLSKGIANGIGLSCCITTPQIANSYNAPSVSTHGGNLVACASALATLQYFREHRLDDHIKTISCYFDSRLSELMGFNTIIDIRGLGLLKGIELCDKHFRRVLSKLFDYGIVVGVCGIARNVLLLEPPLVITESDCDLFIDTMKTILMEIENEEI